MVKKKVTQKKKKPAVKRSSASKKIKKKIIKKIVANRKKKVLAIPKGYHSIIPYLIVSHGIKAIDFYKKAFGAKEVMRMEKPGGKIGRAELKIGDAKIMLADECHEANLHSPNELRGSAISIHFYTKNVDEVIEKSVSLGATLIRPVADMFYGDRSGMLEDPYGHQWHISTHIEDVTPAKLKKRMEDFSSKKL